MCACDNYIKSNIYNGGKYVCEPDDMIVWGYGHTRKELLFLWPLYEFVTHITKHEANMISLYIYYNLE